MKTRIFFIAALIFIAGTAGLIMNGSYPVAMVHWRPISYKVFSADYDAASTYYSKVLQTYNSDNKDVLSAKEIASEVKRAVLDKLVEDQIIHHELKKRMKRGDMAQIIQKKIENATKGKEIEREIKTLYGFSLGEFVRLVLRPQAEREILEGRLILDNKKIGDWLREEKSKANVVVLLPGFGWNGNEIVVNE